MQMIRKFYDVGGIAGIIPFGPAGGGGTSGGGAATTVPISGLLAATATNDINNGNLTQTWRWNTLNNQNGLSLIGVSTGSIAVQSVFSSVITGNGTTNRAAYFSASGGTNNYAIIAENGSVGIGTSLPTSILHVVATPTTGIGVAISSSTVSSGTILDITGTSTALAANNEGVNIAISGANATNAITATGMRISVTNTNATSGTNVGIAVTASGATTNNIAIVAVGHLTFEGVTSTGATGTGALVFGTTPTFTTNITTALIIGGTTTTSPLTLRSTSGVGTTGADIIFQTGNNGATESMRILNGGNVGVGTTAPATTAGDLFQIRGSYSGNLEILIENTSTTGQSNTRVKNDSGDLGQLGVYCSGAGAYGTIGARSAYIYSTAPTSLTIMEDANAPIIFATGSGAPAVERMRIAGDGVVTIANLAGSGSRAVLADASGVLSAPVSDIRLKTNIIPISKTVDVIALLKDDNMRGVFYNWKDEKRGKATEIGLVAQAFQHIPGMTGTMTATGDMYLNYDKITSLLWEQNRALLNKIESLGDEVKKLKEAV